ncbi:superoxide dismutase [Xylaria sp. FL1777]|nr:superoxide dismutase [Xylaria sp. FL1777]
MAVGNPLFRAPFASREKLLETYHKNVIIVQPWVLVAGGNTNVGVAHQSRDVRSGEAGGGKSYVQVSFMLQLGETTPYGPAFWRPLTLWVGNGSDNVSPEGGATQVLHQLGDAVVVTNNPVGKQAVAVFPRQPFFTSGSLHGNVKGSVKASTGAKGVGVDFEVTFSNLPKEGGPFTYHVHVNPVDASGNCTNTLAHLDPFIRGEDPACNSSSPATCQVGDISGKYGKITSDPYKAKFHDDFTAMREGPGSYFLNRSIVVHFANKTRITCANFTVLRCSVNDTTATTDGSCQDGSMPTPTNNNITPFTGGAGAISVMSLALLPMVAILLTF